ncbi:hypothetical protein GJ496_000065 [Pomphorhynchus laevis]|nr:hypothetical protein GJ496_000065 [Pomphorhynchus laevis]
MLCTRLSKRGFSNHILYYDNRMSDSNHPFSDPSIRAAMDQSQRRQSGDDYNPFANMTVPGTTIRPSTHSPTLPQSTVVPSKTVQIREHIDVLEQSRAAIERSDLSGDMYEPSHVNNPREHNFPPLPKFCPFQPCFSQDIQRDIPIAFQKWTTYAFYLWLGLVAILLLNVLAGFVCMIAEISKFVNLIVAVIWFTAISPLSYMLWFRPLYKAFRSDSSLNFMIFFFAFFLHIVFSFMMIIGVFPTGFCGLMIAIEMMNNSGFSYKFAGIVCTLVTILLTLEAIASIIVLIQVHKLYRSTGASLSRAQQELSSNVMSNRHARNAAVNVATTAFTHQ